MAIFLAGKAVCYRILAFFCYGKLHFKCESADLFKTKRVEIVKHCSKISNVLTAGCINYPNLSNPPFYVKIPQWKKLLTKIYIPYFPKV